MSDKLLIANMEIGLERDREPWLLPDQAFPTLEDMYLFRGRIRRRLGYSLLGRLITTVGAVDTINNLPVMGLRTRELTAINQEELIAFDTTKANRYSNSTSAFVDISFHTLPATNAFAWTGSDSDFFWTFNYANAMWTTNNVAGFQNTWNSTNVLNGDGIRWYDGVRWTNFLPQVDSTNYLMGALIIVSYRGRVVALNTQEGAAVSGETIYYQRARWSQNGTPFPSTDPLGNATQVPSGYAGGQDNTAWRSDVVGKGGYIDAPTAEVIVSADFLNDTLIVYFERSTWQLRYTGDPVLPFVWERINVELGAESTFSIVPFDQGLLAVGNYGIMIANNNSVQRIDQKIPDEVFKIHNGNDGVKRVYGIRDYAKQLVYWTFPNETSNPTYPTRVLVYDYIEGTYAIFNDSLTCFGYFQPTNDITWADLPQQWVETRISWNSGQLQSGYPQVVAGNQQGFVFSNYNGGPVINDPSLRITAITQANPAVVTSPNHNLSEGTIIAISDVSGMTEVNGERFRVSVPTTNSFSLQVLDVNNNIVNYDSTTNNAYTSGGFIQVRNNIKIRTKKFNPYLADTYQSRLRQIDYFLEFASGLEFNTEVFLDENDAESVEAVVVLPQTNILQKIWYPAYYGSVGQFNQIQVNFSIEQMFDPTKSDGDLTIHAFLLYMQPAGRLTYGQIV